MKARVVCISRTTASGAEEIGRSVAQRLGFRYVDDEIVIQAAREARVDPEVVADAEHSQSLIDRVLRLMARSVALPVSPAPLLDHSLPGLEDYRVLIRGVVLQTAKKGDVVIMAHAASMALTGMEGLLRILITASEETRVMRIAGERQLSEQDALGAIRYSDGERARYLKRFYQIDQELPTHYDLVINTDVLTAEQATDVIVSAAKG